MKKVVQIAPTRASMFKNGVQGVHQALKGLCTKETASIYSFWTGEVYETAHIEGIYSEDELMAIIPTGKFPRLTLKWWLVEFEEEDLVVARGREIENGATPEVFLYNDMLNAQGGTIY